MIEIDIRSSRTNSYASVFEKNRRVCVTHPPCDQLWAGGDAVGRESRGQNVAIGLTGLPDVPAKRTGATARWKSHWPSSAAVVAHTSRSQLSSSHRPIATRLTA